MENVESAANAMTIANATGLALATLNTKAVASHNEYLLQTLLYFC